MSVGIIKPNISKGLITITCGLLLSLPIVASADAFLTDSINDQTPVSDSQLRLQAYINQMLSRNNSVSTPVANINDEDSYKPNHSISSHSQDNSIISDIRHNFEPPFNNKGQVTLRIRLDKSGNVLSVSASGANAQLNQAAVEAVKKASPLPIDLDNPNKYSNIIVSFQTR